MLLKDAALQADLESWVLARQALERLPALTSDHVMDGIRERQGALRTVHEAEYRVLMALKNVEADAIEALLAENGVPVHMRAPLLARRRNREEEGVRQEIGGVSVQFGTLYLPFGGFSLGHAGSPDNPGLPTPGLLEIRPLLDELSTHLLPLFKFIATHQPLAAVRGALPLCFQSLEEKGWIEQPFVTWMPEQIGPLHQFLPGNLQGGLLSLPVCATDDVSLGVLLEQIQMAAAVMAEDGIGFSRYLGPALPRREAYEDMAGGLSELWSRWVFALTARDQGQAEFALERGNAGKPHRFRGAVRVKDATGQVARMLIHNVTFWQQDTASRIVAPWLTTRASHLPWRMSVSHTAGFEDPRLASPVPFW